MSLAETTVEFTIHKNGEFNPKDQTNRQPPELFYADSLYTGVGEFSVTASTSDEVVAISDLGTVKILILEVSSANTGVISFKLNGGTSEEVANPIVLYSDTLSSLTASNSSTSEVKVKWRAVYV